MDSSDHYPDPFGEALSHSSQRAAQMISLLAAGAEVAARRKALSNAKKAANDEQVRRALQDEQRAVLQQARAGWAAAHDPQWLAQADLIQTARVWGAVAAYADDPVAASAMRKSEEGLRRIHPYAMARYDRLRGEGTSSFDAMREAAPLFAREPYARPGQAGTDLRLEAGLASPDVVPAPGSAEGSVAPQSTPGQGALAQAEHRGRPVVWRLQARAIAERGSEFSPEELATALEEATSLPGEVIARLCRSNSEEGAAASAKRARAADPDHTADSTSAALSIDEVSEKFRSGHQRAVTADTTSARVSTERTAAQLAAESFPCMVVDGIRATAMTGPQQAGTSPVRAAIVQNVWRPGLSPLHT